MSLYRATGTFEEYVKERFGFTTRHAFRLQAAAYCAEIVTDRSHSHPTEWTLRPLTRLIDEFGDSSSKTLRDVALYGPIGSGSGPWYPSNTAPQGTPLGAVLGKHGGDRRSGKATDQVGNADLKPLREIRGSVAYTLARLERDRPELAERVRAGQLSANAAAIDGIVERLRAAMLDGSSVLSDIEKQLLDLVTPFGIGPDCPEFVDLVRVIVERRGGTPRTETVRDEEDRYRAGIVTMCRELNRRLGDPIPWGDAERRLFRIMKKPISEMNLAELKHAASIVSRWAA